MDDTNNNESEVVTAADSGGVQQEMVICIRDGFGNARTLVASGRRGRLSIRRCAGHFIARGVCIDCTQAQGRTVLAE